MRQLLWVLPFLLPGCIRTTGGAKPSVYNGVPVTQAGGDIPPMVKTGLVLVDNGCTGVLITPTRVLTAKHCFGNYDYPSPNQKRFKGSYNPNAASTVYLGPSDSRVEHAVGVVPGSAHLHSALDLAWFDLVAPVPLPYDAVPLWGEDYRISAGDRLLIAGYGWNKQETGRNPVAAVLRYGKVQYTGEFIAENRYPSGDSYRSLLGLSSVEGGQGSCPGDSGGAVFKFANGYWALIGIISGGTCSSEYASQNSLMADIRPEETHRWYMQ